MITYRLQKNSPITAKELDANFTILDERLAILENEALPKLNIAAIKLIGTEIVFQDNLEREISRIALPYPQFIPTGLWQANKNYRTYDICNYENILYFCLHSHQSSVDFADDKSNWQILLDITIKSQE